MANLNKKVQFSRVLNIVLAIILVGVVTFGWWYLTKQNPVETITKVAAPARPEPKYLYTIYGSSSKNLNRPSSTIIHDNKIYVADAKNGRIAIFQYDGKYLSDFGTSGNGKLGVPASMFVVGSEMFVADAGTRKIHVFNLGGEFLRYFAEKTVKFPTSIFYKDEKFFVLDSDGMKVRVLDGAGKELYSFGKEGGAQGEFYHPYNLYVTDDDKIYVADSNNNRIQVFDLQGKLLQVITGADINGNGGYSIPRGIAFDRAGNLYTAEGLSGAVAIADKEGKVFARFGFAEPTVDATGQQDVIKLPTSVFIDNNQRLYVTEYARSRVLVYEIR